MSLPARGLLMGAALTGDLTYKQNVFNDFVVLIGAP
jgi:hypothetical protein